MQFNEAKPPCFSVGQKGIGFKSVFRVSDCPEIHSNGFHIRFDAKSGSIGYILPQWIEQGCEEKQKCDDRVENRPDSHLHDDTDAVTTEYARYTHFNFLFRQSRIHLVYLVFSFLFFFGN